MLIFLVTILVIRNDVTAYKHYFIINKVTKLIDIDFPLNIFDTLPVNMFTNRYKVKKQFGIR